MEYIYHAYCEVIQESTLLQSNRQTKGISDTEGNDQHRDFEMWHPTLVLNWQPSVY